MMKINQMNLCGIDFSPLYEPLETKIQAIATGIWFILVSITGYFSLFFFLYLLTTKFWYISLLYFCWIYFDRNTCEKGGRPSQWIKNWTMWKLMKNYFQASASFDPQLKLDIKKNYLFVCYPHGVIPAGAFINLSSNVGDLYQKHPDFQVRIAILSQNFFLPISREIGLGVGCISSSVESINYVLGSPNGGHILCLYPGGAIEAGNARPGSYKIIIKNRKGFIKMAFKHGVPLVPVITFGETDLFDQIQNRFIRKLQEFFKKLMGFWLVVMVGRGIFQNSFGFIPRKTRLTTVVGLPLDVPKCDPSPEQIEKVHSQFLKALNDLFEQHKYKYLDQPNDAKLEMC